MELGIIVLVRHCYVKSQGGYSLCLLRLTVFVPVRDIGILRIMWILTSDCVCSDTRCHFCCPYLCWEIINDLNNQIIDYVLVSLQLCSGLTNTLEHRYRRSLISGDELEDLRAVVSEQGLALKGLQQAAAEAEERQKSTDAELVRMMATLLKTNR